MYIHLDEIYLYEYLYINKYKFYQEYINFCQG